MFDTATILTVLALVVVLAPAVLLAALGLPALVGRPLGEAPVGRVVRSCVAIALVASVGMFAGMLATGDRHVILDCGHWVTIGHVHVGSGTQPAQGPHYDFAIK